MFAVSALLMVVCAPAMGRLMWLLDGKPALLKSGERHQYATAVARDREGRRM